MSNPMTDTQNNPAQQHVPALGCMDEIHLALEGVIGLSQLLVKAFAHGAPVGTLELYAISNAVRWSAARCEASLELWHRLKAESLPSGQYHSLHLQIEGLNNLAELLAQAADTIGTPELPPPPAERIKGMAALLLGQAETLTTLVSDARVASET